MGQGGHWIVGCLNIVDDDGFDNSGALPFFVFPSAKEKNSTVHSLKKKIMQLKKKKTKKKKPRECTVIFLVLVRQFFPHYIRTINPPID